MEMDSCIVAPEPFQETFFLYSRHDGESPGPRAAQSSTSYNTSIKIWQGPRKGGLFRPVSNNLLRFLITVLLPLKVARPCLCLRWEFWSEGDHCGFSALQPSQPNLRPLLNLYRQCSKSPSLRLWPLFGLLSSGSVWAVEQWSLCH